LESGVDQLIAALGRLCNASHEKIPTVSNEMALFHRWNCPSKDGHGLVFLLSGRYEL
jgi:hypothetical protein